MKFFLNPGHTILILQKLNNPDTRIWTEYENVTMALEAIIVMFEKWLAEMNPNLDYINYQVGDLIGFISQCKEFTILAFDSTLNAYVPQDKSWIQERVVSHLRKKLEFNKINISHAGGEGGEIINKKRGRYI
ncbi:1345_t:CDS:2 [Diversispora eburnea]|uniref:1345_t:CDS:1 n=1 Tax=Diversispora eburnea TaxID=1213867 RepID=A0A9N9ALL2_9GLOM|nr:1345_t:CDS:2 [Diversispora eburnea]